MSEQKESTCISFAKDKIGQYPKGLTGITGTSRKVIEPTDEISIESSELGNLTYNASEQLFKNLDALGKKMNLAPEESDSQTQSEEINLEENNVSVWSTDMLDNLSEEEVIQNLNQHLGYRPAKVDLALRVDKGQILPQNVIEPETFNGKAISQNMYIPDAPVSERKIIETSTTSIKDSFCRNCGSQYLQTDNFCGGCGNKRN